MGLEGISETDEETLSAEYIKALLLGEKIDIYDRARSLRDTSGAKFFDPSQNEVFPKEDFFLCIDYDRFDFAMKLYPGEYGCGYVRKVSI